MRKIEGIFVPIATPFNDRDEIDFGRFAENLAKFGRTGLAGVVAMGSNGESALLSHKEKLASIKAIREGLPKEKMVIAGTGCESLKETIELTKEAADLGVDAALIINPSFYKRAMSNETVIEKFFTAVADTSPVPVMVYNMPGNSGVNIPSKVIVKLAAHPNIAGVKDSGGNIVQIAETIAGVPEDFSVFAGSASFLFATTLLGGKGGTLATANVAPDLCAELFRLSKDGEIEKARELQMKVLTINSYVTATYGIGGLKAAMDMVGFYGGTPRLPLLPANDEVRNTIRVELEKLGLMGKYKG